jgi:exo-beta-1,3-glucanase (GH17 family)
MKNLRFFAVTLSVVVLMSSCGMLSNVFKRKTGCPTNGKNVGAEKLASGDPKAEKAARKAKKFKS